MHDVRNLAVKLNILLTETYGYKISAGEWRLLGQEQDGSQVVSWFEYDNRNKFKIGIYNNKIKTLEILHTFHQKHPIIQASVNASHTALVYVESEKGNYTPYLLLLKSADKTPMKLKDPKPLQVMAQFFYGQSKIYTPNQKNDKFILLTHLDSILIYKSTLVSNESEDNEQWGLSGLLPMPELIVKVFSWAQWDCMNQALYYIHYRTKTQSFAEGEETRTESLLLPTLTALQFHADKPYETVLNIPLNLPETHTNIAGPPTGIYEDNTIPLRVHDCSIDLIILAHESGLVCFCHHYLYMKHNEPLPIDLPNDGLVNFAYSVTLLHHSTIIHAVVEDVPSQLARVVRPSYSFFGDSHLIVHVPDMFSHMLDISLEHEPNWHMVLPCRRAEKSLSHFTTLLGWGPNAVIEKTTLDVINFGFWNTKLMEEYELQDDHFKLALLHYAILHCNDYDFAEQIMLKSIHKQGLELTFICKLMEDYLISMSYVTTRRSLPQSAISLSKLLPLPHYQSPKQIWVEQLKVKVSQERLWNTSEVLLAPRQRLSQFTVDLWIRLWEYLQPSGARFKNQVVVDKLKISLNCYKPEALSRCTTPMSPSSSGPVFISTPLRKSNVHEMLPYHEIDVCTASKQEHIISVNLREISMHLVRACVPSGICRENSTMLLHNSGPSTHAAGTATRFVSAMLEASRSLCYIVCSALGATAHTTHSRGLHFVDKMEWGHRMLLLKFLEQYYLAADSIAYPLPQGFTSFFTYLGYKTFTFQMFIQYVHRNIFELQIDVIKSIISEKDDKDSVDKKLRIIQLIGDGRARRALGSWHHKDATLLKARDHVLTLLSGQEPTFSVNSKRCGFRNIQHSKVEEDKKFSALDTFLQMLTAKASLNELDFNLIIEATQQSLRENKKATE